MHILLIDGESITLSVLTHAISRLGHTVEAFGQARAGVAALTTGVDLVICERDTPELDELDLAKAIQDQRGCDRPRILLMSANMQLESRAPSPPSRVIGTLQKPFDLPTLTRVLSFLDQTRTCCPGSIRPLGPFVQPSVVPSSKPGLPVRPCKTGAYAACPYYNALCGRTLRLWVESRGHHPHHASRA